MTVTYEEFKRNLSIEDFEYFLSLRGNVMSRISDERLNPTTISNIFDDVHSILCGE